MSKPATKPKPAATSKPATKPKPAETSKPWQTTHDLGLLGPRNPCLGPPHPGGRGIQPKHMQWPTVRQAFAPVKCTLIRWSKKYKWFQILCLGWVEVRAGLGRSNAEVGGQVSWRLIKFAPIWTSRQKKVCKKSKSVPPDGIKSVDRIIKLLSLFKQRWSAEGQFTVEKRALALTVKVCKACINQDKPLF